MKMIKSMAALAAISMLAACASHTKVEETSMTTETAAKPIARDAVSAFGIGVSDLEASAKFYRDTLGMKEVMRFNLDYMDEIVFSYGKGGGSAIVLMHWTDGSERNYKDNAIKIVYRVPDPVALAKKIRDDGYEIVREPAPVASLDGALVGFAKDPDGYLIELLPPM
ncbi:MAG: VOC family protein [Hyphomonas sp.]